MWWEPFWRCLWYWRCCPLRCSISRRVVFVIAAGILLALLLWCAWIRRQYAFGGGGMMERTHLVILSHLDFDGQGQLLEVGCGSGPLSIRAALTWPSAQVVGIDYWGVDFGYN